MSPALPLEIERDLITRAQQDLSEFTPLYEAYVGKIYRYIATRVAGQELAEDLTAQVFCEALENIGQYTWRGFSFGAWLFRIAHNLVVDHYRAHHADSLDELTELPDATDVADQVATQYTLSQISAAVQELPAPMREVVHLRVQQDLSHREISQIVGKSEENVKMIYSRAVRQLRGRLTLALALLLTSFWI